MTGRRPDRPLGRRSGAPLSPGLAGPALIALAFAPALVASSCAAVDGVLNGPTTPGVEGYEIEDGADIPLFDHTLTWTGRELIVIGGAGGDLDDGLLVDEPVAWSPANGVRAIGSPPGPVRNRHSAVWTGSEVIIFSGTTEPFGVADGLLTAAAAYDPAAGTWRELPDGPLEAARVRGRGAVFDGHVLFSGGATPQLETEGTIAILDLADEAWSVARVEGKVLTVTATANAAYVLWIDTAEAAHLGRIEPATGEVDDITPPGLPSRVDKATAITSGARLVVWAEASPTEAGQGDGAVTATILDDDSAPDGEWRLLPVEVEFPGSVLGFSELRPLLATDRWLAFMEGAELKWIDVESGAEIRRLLTREQSCALNTEAVTSGEFLIAWGGNCSLVDEDGNELPIHGRYVFTPPVGNDG